MEIKKITVNGREYEFVNSSRNTRTGFAHDTILLINGCERGRNSANYWNRTWECYRYQSVMKGCISNIINEAYNNFISDYKSEKNIKRMTAEKRAEADRQFEDLAKIKELREVYQVL